MLTEKEIEVIRLNKKSFSQIEIAKRLNISQPAVSKFYNNAFRKIADAENVIKLKKELGL